MDLITFLKWKLIPNQFYYFEFEAELFQKQIFAKRILKVRLLNELSDLKISMDYILAFNIFENYFIQKIQIRV